MVCIWITFQFFVPFGYPIVSVSLLLISFFKKPIWWGDRWGGRHKTLLKQQKNFLKPIWFSSKCIDPVNQFLQY